MSKRDVSRKKKKKTRQQGKKNIFVTNWAYINIFIWRNRLLIAEFYKIGEHRWLKWAILNEIYALNDRKWRFNWPMISDFHCRNFRFKPNCNYTNLTDAIIRCGFFYRSFSLAPVTRNDNFAILSFACYVISVYGKVFYLFSVLFFDFFFFSWTAISMKMK